MVGPTARPSTRRWTYREGEPLRGLVAVGVMISMWFNRKDTQQVKQDRPSGQHPGVFLQEGPTGSGGLDQIDQMPFCRFAQNLTGLKCSANPSGTQSKFPQTYLTKKPSLWEIFQGRCSEELTLENWGCVSFLSYF